MMVKQLNSHFTLFKPPPRQSSGRVLASSAGGPMFNPQPRNMSYQRHYKNDTSSSLTQHNNENTGSFSIIKMEYWIKCGMEIL